MDNFEVAVVILVKADGVDYNDAEDTARMGVERVLRSGNPTVTLTPNAIRAEPVTKDVKVSEVLGLSDAVGLGRLTVSLAGVFKK